VEKRVRVISIITWNGILFFSVSEGCEALGSADWSLLWSLDFTFAQFHEAMCRTKNIDTEAVGAIASTVSALRMGKNAFWQDLRDDGASQKDQLIRAQGESWVRQKSKDLVDSLGGLNQVTLTSLSLYQEIFPSYPDFIPK